MDIYRVIFYKLTCTDIYKIQEINKTNVPRNLFGFKSNLQKYVNQIKIPPFTPKKHLTQKCVIISLWIVIYQMK